MTKEEKEILIELFESFKFKPTFGETCTDLEIGRNQALDWCIEEIQKFGCGDIQKIQEDKKEQLEELLEKYSMWLLNEQENVEGTKELIKKAIDFEQTSKAYTLIKSANLKNTRIYVLQKIVDDLESLRNEDEKH